MPKGTVAFSVDFDGDRDILDWLAELQENGENKSAAIRDVIREGRALRQGIASDLAAIKADVREIKRLLRSGVTMVENGGAVTAVGDGDVDPRIAAIQEKLDKLGTW